MGSPHCPSFEKRRDGKNMWRLQVDRKLGNQNKPLPDTEDRRPLCYTLGGGGQLFTTLDLRHAYNQVCLHEKSRDATTINTHRGLFRYTRLPFGVSSAPGIFQSLINKIVKEIPHVCAYLDDILITGKSKHHTSAEWYEGKELLASPLASSHAPSIK